MTVPDPGPDEVFDDAIIVRYDKELGRFVYAGLQQVVEDVWQTLPEARTSDWVDG